MNMRKEFEETKENTDRMRQCPHFQTCSVPYCPLDEFADYRHTKDKRGCKVKKSVRMRLGKNMKTKGLSKPERAGLKAWEERTDKTEHLRRLSKHAFKAHKR